MAKTSSKGLSLKDDLIFQFVFGKTENIDLVIDLLKSILESEEKKVYITNPTIQTEVSLEKMNLEGKRGRLDVRLECEEGIYCIEMQNRNLHNIYKRANFYVSRQMASQLKAGQKYKELKPITMIFILDYKMNKQEENEFKEYVITVNKKYRDKYIDLGFEFIFIYLKDFKNVEHNLENKIEQWLCLIGNYKKEEIEMAVKLNDKVAKAKEELERLKLEREEARLKELEETAEFEEWFAYDAGRTEGKKIGEKRGEKNGRRDVAKKLLKQNVDFKIILNATGLTKEELEKLA